MNFKKDICCGLADVENFLNSLCNNPKKCRRHKKSRAHLGWHFCTGTDDVELFLKGHKDC